MNFTDASFLVTEASSTAKPSAVITTTRVSTMKQLMVTSGVSAKKESKDNNGILSSYRPYLMLIISSRVVK